MLQLSSSDPKLHISTKNVAATVAGFVRFRSVKTNSDGSCVSFVADVQIAVVGAECSINFFLIF